MLVRLRGLFGRLSAKPWLIGAFILCALPSGLVMALLTPPGQVPDEAAHIARAAGLLHGAVIAVRRPVAQPRGGPLIYSGVKADGSLFMIGFGHFTAIPGRPFLFTQADAAALGAIPWFHTEVFTEIPNTGTYFPAFYLPATAGLAAGMGLGFSPYGCVLTGRVLMLAAFLALGAAALWLAAFGEALLLAVLLLPMTLFLAASVNPDGVMAGTACLAAAALTRLGRKPLLLAAAALALIMMAKPPYTPLLGLLLLPGLLPPRRRIGLAALAYLPVLVWVGLVSFYTIEPFFKPPYHPGPLWLGNHDLVMDQTDPAANLHILLADPIRLVSLPWNYITFGGIEKIRETIGLLGALSLRLYEPLYDAWMLAFAAALLGLVVVRRPPFAPPPWWSHGYVLALIGVSIWSICIAMYLNWTNVGDDFIDGMQGRYFIPLLPFLAFVLPYGRRFAVLPGVVPALPVVALGLFDLGYLPQQLVAFFYLH